MVMSVSGGLYENLKISGLNQVSSGSKTEESNKKDGYFTVTSDSAQISSLGNFLVSMPEELKTDMQDFRNSIKEAAAENNEFDADKLAESASEELQAYAAEQGVSLSDIAQETYNMEKNAPAEGMYGMKPGGMPPQGPPPSGGMPSGGTAGVSDEESTEEALLELLKKIVEEAEDDDSGSVTVAGVTQTDDTEETETASSSTISVKSDEEDSTSSLFAGLLEKLTSTEGNGSYEYKYSLMMNSLLFNEL